MTALLDRSTSSGVPGSVTLMMPSKLTGKLMGSGVCVSTTPTLAWTPSVLKHSTRPDSRWLSGLPGAVICVHAPLYVRGERPEGGQRTTLAGARRRHAPSLRARTRRRRGSRGAAISRPPSREPALVAHHLCCVNVTHHICCVFGHDRVTLASHLMPPSAAPRRVRASDGSPASQTPGGPAPQPPSGPASQQNPGSGLTPAAERLIRQARFASVRTLFDSDAELAALLKANRSRASRWKAGDAMDDERWALMQGLDTVVGQLRGWLEPTTIPKWLHGVNAHLGHRRPLDVLQEGRLSEVVAAIEAEKSGAFA